MAQENAQAATPTNKIKMSHYRKILKMAFQTSVV
jgi:hypothetical protein